MTWRWTGTSVTGQSHTDRNEQGQDYSQTRVIQLSDKEFFISLVSDGAGSTKNGGLGAKIACEAMMNKIISSIRNTGDIVASEEEVRNWVSSVRNSMETIAQKNDLPLREYACTLLGAIISDNDSVFFRSAMGEL